MIFTALKDSDLTSMFYSKVGSTYFQVANLMFQSLDDWQQSLRHIVLLFLALSQILMYCGFGEQVLQGVSWVSPGSNLWSCVRAYSLGYQTAGKQYKTFSETNEIVSNSTGIAATIWKVSKQVRSCL
jgi:hypothetical protein